MRKRILVTNDDGIYAQGINTLVEYLIRVADVTVIAPDRQKSAQGHALTIDDILLIKEVEMPCGYKGTVIVDGTPTDCVLIGIKELMKDNLPDLVISGINHGANLGGDILYSGTVAGALEGLTNGVTSFAVSLDTLGSGFFETAAEVVLRIIRTEEFYRNVLQNKSILNINVPNVPYEELRGFRITRQGEIAYQNYVEKYLSPSKKTFYWIGGDRPPHELEEDTDSYAIAKKMVSITPINIDMTNYPLMIALKKASENLKIP